VTKRNTMPTSSDGFAPDDPSPKSRPESEVGTPFYDIVYPGAFANSDHRDHVHIGFD